MDAISEVTRRRRRRARRGRRAGAGRALARPPRRLVRRTPPRSASTRARTSARSATPARSPPTTPTLTRKTPVVCRPRPARRHQARTRPIGTQQPPRRAAGRDPVDQAHAASTTGTRRGARRPTCTARSSTATNCRVLQSDPRSTPVHHLEIVRVPQRDAGVERARRARDRLGSPLPDSDAISRRPSQLRTWTRTSSPKHAAGEIVSVPMFPTITPP